MTKRGACCNVPHRQAPAYIRTTTQRITLLHTIVHSLQVKFIQPIAPLQHCRHRSIDPHQHEQNLPNILCTPKRAAMTPIDMSKIIFTYLITLHPIADIGAMNAIGVSKLPFKCMLSSFISNTSFTHKKTYSQMAQVFTSILGTLYNVQSTIKQPKPLYQLSLESQHINKFSKKFNRWLQLT